MIHYLYTKYHFSFLFLFLIWGYMWTYFMRFIYNLFLNKMFFFLSKNMFLSHTHSLSLSPKHCFLTWSVSLALTVECLICSCTWVYLLRLSQSLQGVWFCSGLISDIVEGEEDGRLDLRRKERCPADLFWGCSVCCWLLSCWLMITWISSCGDTQIVHKHHKLQHLINAEMWNNLFFIANK